MSITKSYNKHTGVYYAYDTTYEWDEERQKKVQHKRCIGKFDPITGEVIPNGKVGRPSRSLQANQQEVQHFLPYNGVDASGLAERCEKIEYMLSQLSSEIQGLKEEINRIPQPKEGTD